ncbi:hypothetical protein FISHEDRAFT_76062 [Fistulina hepatica ATCC 64428]|uniref:Uncharacterized protein n=1 Tax=Fistulina hepatica ATCC 64428 TaxID=1128425 RepID=A0A0D7A4Q6_9AGAR|nr:hypothetical protein FISHEDRAFT_76062 [Fistulina hepatica ATCC 64428]
MLSVEQKSLAEECIRAAGLSDRVRVHLLDYRETPASFRHVFDALVSIETPEQVGLKHFDTYFRIVDFALKPRNVTVVISASSFPESHFSAYQPADFVRKYHLRYQYQSRTIGHRQFAWPCRV